MPIVTVAPELYQRIEQAAEQQHLKAEEVLGEALRQYLWELDRRQISEEAQRYRQQYAALKLQYLGQHIAMLNGQVVDHDVDFLALRQRIRQHYGPRPVMMTYVDETLEQPITRLGFRWEARVA